MLEVITKKFSEINTNELYAILQLRSEVFVVEQDCVYQDLDFKDQKALHIIGYKDDKVVAYTRIFKPGDYFENSSIGRVVVAKNERKYGFGHVIIESSIEAIEENYKEKRIKISAQVYLKKFYESHGFYKIGEKYMEDGIPHIAMIKE